MRKTRITVPGVVTFAELMAVPGVVGVGVVPGRLAKAAETTTHSFLSAKKTYKQTKKKNIHIDLCKRTESKRIFDSSLLIRRSVNTHQLK